jgi:hypothetical protein
VGAAALFAGYDVNILRTGDQPDPASLHIPKIRSGPPRPISAPPHLSPSAGGSADLGGRRRLLLFTIFGQAIFTLLTAFAATLCRVCRGAILHPRLRLCRRDAAVRGDRRGNRAKARGWANSTLIAFYFTGAGWRRGIRRGGYSPFGWRALVCHRLGADSSWWPSAPAAAGNPAFRTTARQAQGGAILSCCRISPGNIPARVTVIIAAAASAFAISPPTFLAQKYLQDVYHYTPPQVSLVLIPAA